jgi:hypothetical protein
MDQIVADLRGAAALTEDDGLGHDDLTDVLKAAFFNATGSTQPSPAPSAPSTEWPSGLLTAS